MNSFHLDENGCVRDLFDGRMDGAREGEMTLAVVYSSRPGWRQQDGAGGEDCKM